MGKLSTVRTIVFGTVTLFALVELAIAAHMTSLTTKYGFYITFALLDIAVAVITFVTLPILMLIDRMRKGAFTSLVVVEISWIWVMWVMWLSVASDTAADNALSFQGSCSRYTSVLGTVCGEMQAIEAFAFLNWFLLFGYVVTLIIFAIKSASSGRKTWLATVQDITWNGEKDNGSTPYSHVQTPTTATYPPSVPQGSSPAQSPAPQESMHSGYQGGYPQQGYPQQQGYVPQQPYSQPQQGYQPYPPNPQTPPAGHSQYGSQSGTPPPQQGGYQPYPPSVAQGGFPQPQFQAQHPTGQYPSV